MKETLERLAAAGIQLVPMPGLDRHYVVARGRLVSLVEKSESGFGRAGSAGWITESGLMLLVWREGKPYFVAKGKQLEATPEQVEALRRFSADLVQALAEPPASPRASPDPAPG